jgi:RimJ/RimL family protein N-acetyltransferase
MTAAAWVAPGVLTGVEVSLEPLTLDHAEALHVALGDDETWTWVAPYRAPDLEGMRSHVAEALTARDGGLRLPYVHVRQSDRSIVGTTSFLDLDLRNRGIEIGHTVLGPSARRTAANTEAKLLMLGYAFDHGMERVALRTDHLNLRSQAAIERLGATREGVLRHHRLRADGSWRDTVTYSILSSEWPEVRDRLVARMNTTQ